MWLSLSLGTGWKESMEFRRAATLSRAIAEALATLVPWL